MNLQIKIKVTQIFLILFTLSLFSCSTSTVSSEESASEISPKYEKIQSTQSYKSLATLDLDQMNDLIQSKLNEYNKQNNLQVLREAAMLVFSRPDEDGMVEKIIAEVRNPLDEEGQWNSTIEALVYQSVETVKNAEASPTDQVTAGVILENIISEFKPLYIKQFKTGGFETQIINYIAVSKAQYTKSALKERSLYLMRNNLSPNQIAQKILDFKVKSIEDEQKNKENNKKNKK